MDAAATTPAKKRVVIALPGRSFSDNFVVSLMRTLGAMWSSDEYEPILAPGYSSFVGFARMKTLGLDVLRGSTQKPFPNLDYFAWITIDSDQVWTPENFFTILRALEIHPVVSGLYRMQDLKHFACVRDWDTEYFKKHGTFKFLTPEDVRAYREETGLAFMPVSYNGMGFMAVRRDALEALEYPYFYRPLEEIDMGDGRLLRDMCSEDVAFCKNLADKGFQIMVDTNVVVGHEKALVI